MSSQTPTALPRGPHALTRAEVLASQRARLISSFTQLLSAHGYAAVTIGELARHAGVSRGAFYEQFSGKEACLLAAYDEFATDLLGAMTKGLAPDATWEDFVSRTLRGYLGSLESDPVSARAFIVEMDAAGSQGRERRRQTMRGFAALFSSRHSAIRAIDSSLGPLPERVFLGLALGVRELVHERLCAEEAPVLTDLAPDVILWITSMIEGAAAAHLRMESM